MSSVLSGHILTPSGWLKGHIHFDDQVLAIEGRPSNPADDDLPRILPGFIDLHVHGGGGRDVMDGGDALATIAGLHAAHGTTSLLATTMTAPVDDIEQALRAVAAACADPQAPGACVLGVHLEGPYIHPDRLGAQPDHTRLAHWPELQRWAGLAPLRLVTLAPEMPGHLALVAELVRAGVRVQLGHSQGSYEEGVAALALGASGFAHLFNAMSPMHHRQPGMVGAALAHAEFAELIPDLLHVHPGAMRAALRAIPRLYCVTDSTSASGMPDGVYQLGRQTVHKCLGGVRLANGTLAGSTLTMDQALRNLVGLGLDLADASRRVSTFPADFLGETQRGRLAPGCLADIVVLDAALDVRSVHVQGRRHDLADA